MIGGQRRAKGGQRRERRPEKRKEAIVDQVASRCPSVRGDHPRRQKSGDQRTEGDQRTAGRESRSIEIRWLVTLRVCTNDP